MMHQAQISAHPRPQAAGLSKRTGGRAVQRKCACGGSAGSTAECEACGDKKQKELQRYSADRESFAGLERRLGAAGAVPPQDSATGSGIVAGHDFGRVQVHSGATAQKIQKKSELGETAATGAGTTPDRGPAPAGLIVEDDTVQSAPGQMRKTEFLNQLERAVCATADQELARVGRTAQGCPYIERWIAYYRTRSSQQIERALYRYAPEAAGARSAGDYIPIVAERIRRAVTVWATTGRITGVPEELAGQIGTGGFLGGAAAVLSGIGGAVAGAIGSIGRAIGGIFTKAKDGGPKHAADPEQVQAQLGSGQGLDAGVKSRMEQAMSHDFSTVRVHTDSRAAELSSELSARAFTVGSDIAFAAGEYRPGTLIGDALLAHELAHVVQQAGGTGSAAPMQKGETQHDSLEEEADLSAIGAVTSIWSGTRSALKGFAGKATPHLRSGLGLQRCHPSAPPVTPKTLPTTQGQPAPPSPGQGAPTSSAQPACVSTRSLTWSDFQGSAPANPPFSAVTSSGFDVPGLKPKHDITDTKEECKVGNKKSTTHTAKMWVDPADYDAIQPTMDPTKSWVLLKYKDPDKYCPTVTALCETEIDKQAAAASKTCKQGVKPCEQFFDEGGKEYKVPVDSTEIKVTSKDECATTLVSGCEKALAKNQLFELKEDCEKAVVVRATSRADCSSKKSSEDCLKYYRDWSARLLKHEQGHLDISTILAGKARADLKAMAPKYTATASECGRKPANDAALKKFNALNPSDITQRGQDWLNLKDKAHKDYDDQTDHGCKQPEQATWLKNIANCLPAYDLNPPAASAQGKPGQQNPTPAPANPGGKADGGGCGE
jgi:hypothetical protein